MNNELTCKSEKLEQKNMGAMVRFNINNHTPCSLTDLSILENRKRLLGDKWHFHNVYLDGDCLDYIDVHYDKLIQLKIYKEIMR